MQLTVLTFVRIITIFRCVYSKRSKDHIVNCYVCEYEDSDGRKYLKQFEVKPGVREPYIPETGTNDRINELEFQF